MNAIKHKIGITKKFFGSLGTSNVPNKRLGVLLI